MDKEIIKIIVDKWEEFIKYQKEVNGDYRDNNEYNFGDFMEYLEKTN